MSTHSYFSRLHQFRIPIALIALLFLAPQRGWSASIIWINTAGGNWNSAANWSPNQVPAATDDALITNNGTYTVILDVSATINSLTLGGANGTQTLTNFFNTLTLNGPSTIDINGLLILDSATLDGSGDLLVRGTLRWAAGTLSGTGATTIENSGVLILGGTAANNTDLYLKGRTLNNSGKTFWNAGTIGYLDASPVINNLASGTFDCTFDGQDLFGFNHTFANFGLFRKTGGAGSTVISAAFNNSGTVEVQTGTLTLGGGGTNSGVVTVAAGGTLDFLSGAHSVGLGSIITGAGNVSVSGGTLDVTGATFNLSGTNTFSSGTANFTGNYTITNNTLSVLGGTVNFNGDGTVAPAILNLSSGILGGTNAILVSGPLIWTGGVLNGSGPVNAIGGLMISPPPGNSVSISGRTLNNAGHATWTSGFIRDGSGSVISNLAGGIFDCISDGQIISGGGTHTFANAGVFRRTGATGTTDISAEFNNSGTVEIQTGALNLSGIYIQTAGLTLLDGGNITNTSPLQIQGGVLAGTGIIAGSVTNNGVVSPGTSPGLLSIAGDYTQTSSGVLKIELAGQVAGTNFDFLAVGGAALLDGALTVTLTNGFYPPAKSGYTFLLAPTRNNVFPVFNYPSNVMGMNIDYTTTNATIHVINVLPVIVSIAEQGVDELTTLSFTVASTDDDQPPQTLRYALANSPAGATINPGTGLFSWTPTEEQGPNTNNVTVLVTDNGTPNLTTSRTFTVVIREVNVAPVLSLPSNPTINEQTTLAVNVTATDSDIPANSLSFELLSGPSGLTMSSSGAITWTTTETDGPNVYTVTIRVTDNNPDAITAKQLSATNSFTITVNEVNTGPVLTVPPNQAIAQGTSLNVSASATDADIPANTLIFTLVSGPAGLTIEPNTGVISWMPTAASASSTHDVTVRVTDNGTPSLSDTKTFTISVEGPPRVTAIAVATATVTLTWTSSAGKTYRVQRKNDLGEANWTDLSGDITASDISATKIDNTLASQPQRFYRVEVLP